MILGHPRGPASPVCVLPSAAGLCRSLVMEVVTMMRAVLKLLPILILAVSDRGGKYGYVVQSRQNVYRALRRKGYSKSKAARISNAGRSKGARQAMGRKAAAHRRARRR